MNICYRASALGEFFLCHMLSHRWSWLLQTVVHSWNALLQIFSARSLASKKYALFTKMQNGYVTTKMFPYFMIVLFLIKGAEMQATILIGWWLTTFWGMVLRLSSWEQIPMRAPLELTHLTVHYLSTHGVGTISPALYMDILVVFTHFYNIWFLEATDLIGRWMVGRWYFALWSLRIPDVQLQPWRHCKVHLKLKLSVLESLQIAKVREVNGCWPVLFFRSGVSAMCHT